MARKVGMSNKDFLMKLQEWGIEAKSHLNVLEDDEVKKIQEKLNQVTHLDSLLFDYQLL